MTTPPKREKLFGFTLAEMMVVMLIMSIIMAAFAPVVTTRNKSGDNSERWRWARNRSDIYYGIADTQVAMIGQNEREATDPSSKLLISTIEDGQSHILFKHATNAGAGTILGRLYMDDKGNYGLSNSQLKGEQNTAFGYNTLTNISPSATSDSGNKNTAIGYEALKSNTSGYYNTAVGELALTDNTSGWRNVAIGNSAMRNNLTGEQNVGLGANAIEQNLSGSDNTAVGQSSLALNKTGNNNTAVGQASLYSNDSGYNNVAVGKHALFKNTTGYYNVAVGLSALSSVTDGVNNTAVGYEALAANTASTNTAVGESALKTTTSGDGNSALGNSALRLNTTGTYNTALGVDSFYSNTTGSYNIGIGHQSGYYNTTGSNNIAIGHQALRDNTTSSENTAIGYHALAQTTSSNNVAIGNYSSRDNVSGSKNTSVGYDSLRDNTGSNNVAIGFRANMSDDGSTVSLYNTTAVGSYAKALDYYSTALGSNAKATGSYSTALGYNATAAGKFNVALGYNACQFTKGSNKICIGAFAGPRSDSSFASESDDEERIFIGGRPRSLNPLVKISKDDGNATLEIHNISGKNSKVIINGDLIIRGNLAFIPTDIYDQIRTVGTGGASGDSQFQGSGGLGMNNAEYLDKNHFYTDGRVPSDRRLKYVGSENKNGLDKIRELKIFNYTFKKDRSKTPHVGVIAQDLQKVFPDAVTKGEDGFLRIRLEDMFYAAINAIKELATRMDRNEQKIKQLEQENKELKARLERLEKALK